MNEQKNEVKRPQIRGKVVAVLPLYQSPSGFVKREIVVDTGYNRPCPIKVTFKQDRSALAESVAEGDVVTVTYALDGRAWDGGNGVRYFVDVVGLELSVQDAAPATQKSAIDAWRKTHGADADNAGLIALCKARFPGKRSAEYTTEDWAAIVKAIKDEAEAAAQAAQAEDEGDPDDLPF